MSAVKILEGLLQRAWQKSHDKETPVGALVRSAEGEWFGTNHYVDKPLPEKSNIVHAEIAAFGEMRRKLRRPALNATIYITKACCESCAYRIREEAVRRVVMPPPDAKSRWKESQWRGVKMLRDADIQVDLIGPAERWIDGLEDEEEVA